MILLGTLLTIFTISTFLYFVFGLPIIALICIPKIIKNVYTNKFIRNITLLLILWIVNAILLLTS